MKKKLLFSIILIIIFFLAAKDTYAYSSSDYANKTLCAKYEVVQFKSDGTIETKSCEPTFDGARVAMKTDGGPDIAILTTLSGKTKVIDANAALVDFTHPTTTINIYSDKELASEYTYMNGQSGYGGVDGALLDSGYSNSYYTFTNKVKISGVTGWVRSDAIEIVPLIWVKSSSSYTVSNTSIKHNYVTKIQNTYSGSSGTTMGPKPSMLSEGTYYSYDGHYFYSDRYKMIKDYRNNTYTNSVNKDKPYYNYYQFLPSHTKTTYSSVNIDEYIRNVLGYGRDVFGTTALTKQSITSSRLYGMGTFFYNAQETYGVNALFALGISRNESGNGKSNIAINKNNGFGLNAVDSSPGQSANWYATFSSSILGFANKWVTYGYSHPRNWRYFGSQTGNKYVGMNVKYASDVYWGEKMAANYYSIDKALGLQDYNYYQTGVTTKATMAQSSPSTNKNYTIYNYKSADNGLVILEEVEGESVDGNKKWYKVISDININKNFKEITSGNYNWDSYVYVPAAHVIKTNEGKNGYTSPTEVTEYQDKNYTYDLHIVETKLSPKVAKTLKDTNYYYDPTLLSKTGKKLLADRYVMVFATAYDENKKTVAYLVTSDYKYDQKHWVNVDSIKFVTSKYGQASVTVEGQNTYTIVNPTTVDELSTHISGLYHYAYTPILEEKTVNGHLWYKVPVNLSGTTNVYGWTLAEAPDVKITKYSFYAENQAPVINATDKIITQGKSFNELEDITAIDEEDGNITSKLKVKTTTVNINTPGTYEITYEVTDNNEETTIKTIKVTVIADEEPVIYASNKIIVIGSPFDPKDKVYATDKEDGTITNIEVDDSKVKYDEEGDYEITYTVKDSFGHIVKKTIILSILEELTLDHKKEKEGTFYFDYLDNIDNRLKMRGYLTINGMNNTLSEEITYYVTFVDIDNPDNSLAQVATRITDLSGIDRPIYSVDGKKYTHAWFEAELAVDELPIGNYVMVVVAEGEETYSMSLVTNKLYKTEVTGFQTEEKTVNIKNNYSNRTSAVTLYIRDKEIPKKTVGSYYNQYDIWREFDFVDNKLHIKGATYSYGMNLSKSSTVTRSIIFENQDTYQTHKYNIGSITNGLYTVALPVSDNLDKTRAWYDATIDIATLPKGKYKIYITTTSNVTDYSEFTDNLGRELTDKKITIGEKKYQFILNKEEGNSIELEVS